MQLQNNGSWTNLPLSTSHRLLPLIHDHFLFERKAHCVSAQVMRLFLYMRSQHKSANHNQSLWWFSVLLVYHFQPSQHEKKFVLTQGTSFLSPYLLAKLHCPLCQDYWPTKVRQTHRSVSVQQAGGASFNWDFLIIMASRHLDAKFSFWVGSMEKKCWIHCKICASTLNENIGLRCNGFKTHCRFLMTNAAAAGEYVTLVIRTTAEWG